MQLTELESLLDNLKGEESVFSLYNQGRYGELEEIYNVFQKTNLTSVSKLSNALDIFLGRPVYGIFGPKGVGKSTLLSTTLLHYYIKGNIDAINYLRYSPDKDNFETIFRLEKENAKRAVTVFDDIHYSIPKFLHNVFVKGSVRFFDNFNAAMVKLNKFIKNYPSSMLIYISDNYGFKPIRDAYFEVLFAAGRSDLIRLIPGIPTKSNEISIDNEFYARTFSILGGNPKTYEVASRFGEVLELEHNKLFTTPRALKILIGELSNIQTEETPIFHDLNIFGKIIRNEIKNKENLVKHFDQKVHDELMRYRDAIVTEYTGEMYVYKERVLNAFQSVVSTYEKILDRLSYIVENHPELTMLTEKDEFGYSISALHSLINSSVSTESAIKSELRAIFDVNSMELNIPNVSGDIDGIWHSGSRLIESDIARRINKINISLNQLDSLLKSSKGLSNSIRHIYDTISGIQRHQYDLFPSIMRLDQVIKHHPSLDPIFSEEREEFLAITREYVGKISPLSHELKNLNKNLTKKIEYVDKKSVMEDVRRIGSEIYEKRISPLKDQLRIYADALAKTEKIKEYIDTYNNLRSKLLSAAAKQSNVFSKEDMNAVKELVESPENFMKKINPNTIGLIRNLSILPY